MLDYIISAVYFKGAEPLHPQFTDFTDFPACFDVLEESLALRAGAYMSINYLVLDGEDTLNDDDIIIRYGYARSGQLAAYVLDGEGKALTQGFMIIIDRDSGRLKLLPIGRDKEEVVDDALKIIQDYGTLIVAGINWGAFLLHENAEGRLEQYFEDALNQEIH